MRDFPTLYQEKNSRKGTACSKNKDVNEHERLSNIILGNNSNKGTACSKKGYGCK